ncbi:lipopolysaccharide biosynthesis protein [Modestobacter sp. SYSU DS0290]
MSALLHPPGDGPTGPAGPAEPAGPTGPVAAVDGRALGGRAARGAAVALTAQGLRIGVQVLSVVVLARLLAPRDYGLLAMVMAVIGVADVFRDLGLSTAAVQARSLSAQQRSNLFWINTAVGLLLSATTVAVAPLLAAAYGQPELTDMARALAPVFLLNGLTTQYRADLTRRLQFARLAVADVAAPVVALLAAVSAALLGAGYWALVVQQLVQYLVVMLLVVSAGRWLPRRPDRRTDMGGLLRFGWNMVGIELIGYAGKNVDSLLIGGRFGAGALGLYNRAFQLLMVPLGQLRAPTTQVALPVLSSLQEDPERYATYLRRGQLALGYTLVVGMGAVAGAADPVTAVFLGPQWDEVTPLLRLLALGGGFQTLAFVGYWVYLSRGLTGQLVRFSLFETSVRIACIVVGSGFGLTGVAAGFALAPALTWPLSFWWLSRHAPIPLPALLAGGARIVLVAAVVGSASWGATLAVPGPPVAALGAAAVAGAAVLLLLGLAPGPFRDDERGVLDIARLALRRRSARPGGDPDGGRGPR